MRWLIPLTAVISANVFAASGNRLYVASASATSYLRGNWNKYDENYQPNYAFDDDPKTAWIEGRDGNGEGELLSVPLSKLQTADKLTLQIRNGYQKSKALMEANSAPKDLTFHILDKNGRRFKSVDKLLQRRMGWQTVEIPLGGREGLAGFEVEIKSV